MKKSLVSNYICTTLCFLVFISNFTQLPIFHGNGLIKILLLVMWGMLLALLIINYIDILRIKFINLILLVLSFDILILVFQIVTGNNYLTSDFIYPLHLSIFILFVSYFCGQVLNKECISKISNYIIISCFIVTIVIYFNNFYGVAWANSLTYIYSAKNSIAQITLVSCVLLIFIPNCGFNKVIKLLILLFNFMFIIMLKSRATLIGIGIVTAYFIYLKFKKSRNKIVTISLVVVILSYVITSDFFENFIIKKIILNNRENADLNTLTSGRADHLNYFFENFNDVFWVGGGNVYLESLPLSALMSYGIIAGLILILLAFIPAFYLIRYKKINKLLPLRNIVIILFLSMISNGIFEQLAPFGPGVKCYTLWLFTGLYIGMLEKEFIK